MELHATEAIRVYVGGLDGTTARSVSAFVESRLPERFSVADRGDAAVLLVDLDQPAARREIEAARADQVVVGVGFEPAPVVDGCQRYLQKPLTGSVVVDELAEAAALVGKAPRRPSPPRPRDRFSHARDVFTAPPGGVPRPRRVRAAADWQVVPAHPRLDRHVHARASVLAAEVGTPGSTAGAAEQLGRGRGVEPVVARDGGDLADPAVLASYRYDPGRHLDGWIARAEADHAGHPWEIRGPALAVVGGVEPGILHVDAPDTVLRRLALEPVGEHVSIHRLRRPAVADWRRLRREHVLWDVAVWSSSGRLPSDLDPAAPVLLREWPDLTRCRLTPSVLPVLALLAWGPIRPLDLPDALAVPRTHAFVVVAAAHRLGLLDGAAAPADRAHPRPAHPERGVLHRLLGRLRAS